MTTPLNRRKRRQLQAETRGYTQTTRDDLAELVARKNWLLRAQHAFEIYQLNRGVGSSTRELILHLKMQPPVTMTLVGGKIQVELTTDKDSELVLDHPHLCRYTSDLIPYQPRQAVVLFALRNRRDEINRIMMALRQR